MNKNTPSVIIHVGDGKCGTTSIQKSLSNCKAELASKHKILYHPVSYNHFEYIKLLGLETRSNSDSSIDHLKRNIDETRLMLDTGEYDYVLFSAESFIGQDPTKILDILQCFLKDEAVVHIVAYIRDPIEYYLSAMQQRLKGHSSIIEPKRFFRDINKMLTSWANEKRVTHFHARQFSRKKLVDGSAVKDFSDFLSSVCEKKISIPDFSVNESLSAEQLIVLQDFRKEFLKDHDGKLRKESNLLINFFDTINSEIGLVKNKPALNLYAINDVALNYIDCLNKIESNFGSLDFLNNASVNPYFTVSYENQSPSNDVRSILAKFDNNVVKIFKNSLPQLNKKFNFRDSVESLEELGLNSKCMKAYLFFIEKLNSYN